MATDGQVEKTIIEAYEAEMKRLGFSDPAVSIFEPPEPRTERTVFTPASHNRYFEPVSDSEKVMQ